MISTLTSSYGQVITSDGSQARPYCSWLEVCKYDSSIEILCAKKLCEASGFFSYDPSTVFVSSSGSMCTGNVYGGDAWYYVVDKGNYSYGGYGLESAITARCSASTMTPSSRSTTVPSFRPTASPSSWSTSSPNATPSFNSSQEDVSE